MSAPNHSKRQFMLKRCIPTDTALAAWIQKVGVKTAAKDSGIPEAQLDTVVKKHFPAGPALLFNPVNFGLGCVVEDADREGSTPAREAVSEDKVSIDALKINDNARLPKEHWIKVPRIDSSTDQGRIGSCVSWSGAHLMDNVIGSADGDPTYRANPSTIYGFIKANNLDPWPTEHGSTMEALAEALHHFGAAAWDTMPVYREAPSSNPANLPHPQEAVAEARQNRIQKPLWIQSWNDGAIYKAMCLMHGDTEKYPDRQLVIATAFYVPDSLFNAYTAETGIVMMPPDGDEILGGHAAAFIGWKEINGSRYFVVKNSWGTDFGDGGYLYVPEPFIKKYFKQSFVAPALLRETQSENMVEKKAKRLQMAETMAVGSSVIAAFLIFGLVTLLLAVMPSLLATGDTSVTEPASSEMHTPIPDKIGTPARSEQMSNPQEQNVLEIYSRTLRLLDLDN